MIRNRIAGALAVLCLCAVLLCGFSASCFADAGRSVRVGWFQSGGEAHEYIREYLQALAQYTGWEYEYVDGSWDECVQWLREGKIDLLGFMHKTPEREGVFAFPELPMAITSGLLVTDQTGELYVRDGMKVGIVSGNAYNDDFAKYAGACGLDVEYVEYGSLDDIDPALKSGEIDAAVLTDEDKNAGERVIAKFASRNQYFAVNAQDTALLAELDAAMVQVNTYCPYFNSDLYLKYFNLSADGKPIFTAGEQEFIDRHPSILVMYDAGWPPIEYYDETEKAYKGISPDLFALLSEKCGINFVYEGSTSGQVLGDLQNDDLHNALTTISYDYGWAEKHDVYITQPFITSNIVKLGKNPGAADPLVAINENAYFTYALKDALSGVRTRHYAKQAQRLEAVRKGEADYTFVTEDQANYYRSIPRYASLKVEKMVGCEQKVCISIKKNSDPELMSIISKSLASITHDEMTAIIRRNTVNSYKLTLADAAYQNRAVIIIAIAVICALTALFAARANIDKTRRIAADEANKAKSSFLSHVSHDIRTPLNAIIGITALAIEENDPAIKQEYLKKINESGKYLQGLVNDTLDMSKIESGKLTLRYEPANFAEIYDVIAAVIMPRAIEKSIRLTSNRDEVPNNYVMLDKLRFEQIILNLLGNAVKFTPEGGRVDCTLEVIEHDDEQVRYQIAITDTGVGMSDAFMKKLFQPFEQERNRLSVENSGTGLGLSIVKSLVDMMGGKITCNSVQNKGTTFTVELTSKYATDAEIEEEGVQTLPLDDSIFIGKRVMLAEDNSMNILVAVKTLEKKGMAVTVVKNGKEAVDAYKAAENPFDVILMDIHMPIMDGLEATKLIRQSGCADAKKIAIIALSANAYDEDRNECFAAGMNDHVIKPIVAADLYAALKRALVAQP